MVEIEKDPIEDIDPYHAGRLSSGKGPATTGFKIQRQIYKYLQSVRSKTNDRNDMTELTQTELLKKYCSDLLQKTDGNVAQAAKIAGMNDQTFRSQLKRLKVK